MFTSISKVLIDAIKHSNIAMFMPIFLMLVPQKFINFGNSF